MDSSSQPAQLLVRCGAWLCGLPLSQVIETMRVLPLQPIAGVPPFVRGLSVIRGELVPVVTLAALLGDAAVSEEGRLVLVRAGERRLALHVDEVLRVVPHSLPQGVAVAPLLRQALPDAVAALSSLDGAALALLSSMQLLSDEVWAALAQGTSR